MPALKAIIGGDASALEREFMRVGVMARGLGRSITSSIMGAIGVAGMGMMVRSTVQFADELVNASKRLGVTIEQLQVLRELAKQNGAEFETMTKGLENIDAARSKALKGDKGTMAAFSSLGITQGDLLSKTAAQLFLGPMHQAATTQSPETLGPVMKEIMGKPFRELMATMTADYDGLKKRMEDAGLIMSSEVAVKLKALGDEFSLLSRIVATQVGPALVKFAEWAYKAVLGGSKRLVGTAGAIEGATQGKSTLGKVKSVWDMFFAEMNVEFREAMGIAKPGERAAWAKVFGFNVEAGLAGKQAAEEPFKVKEAEFAALLANLEAAAKERPKIPDFEFEVESKGRAKDLHGHLTSLQEIGAYASPAQVTLLDTAKKSEKTAKKSEEHLEVIKNHVIKIGAASGTDMGGPKY